MTGLRGRLLLCLLVVPLAGCLPGSDTVDRSASTAATVEVEGYQPTQELTRAFDATVEVSLSGDVELRGRQPVNATVFVRRYGGSARVGVVTSPAVAPIEDQAIYRDPVATLSATEQVELALGESISLARAGELSVTLLGQAVNATVYDAGGTTVTVVSVRDGDDFVTVVVAGDVDVEKILRGVRHGAA